MCSYAKIRAHECKKKKSYVDNFNAKLLFSILQRKPYILSTSPWKVLYLHI